MKLTVLLSLFLLSCASRRDYSQDRVSGQPLASKMPNFQLLDFHFKRTTKEVSREPASENQYQKYSAKKLYFLTLYSQYLQLRNWTEELSANSSQLFSSKKLPQINSCPHFHDDILKNEKFLSGPSESQAVTELVNSTLASDREDAFLFPELYLSSKNGTELIELSNITKEKMNEAFFEHAWKLYQDLLVVCESGSSDNLYVFQNLMNFFQEHHDFHYSQRGLKALLKTPIFSTMYILYLARAQSINSSPLNHFEKQLLTALKVEWFTQYPAFIVQRRAQKSYISRNLQ